MIKISVVATVGGARRPVQNEQILPSTLSKMNTVLPGTDCTSAMMDPYLNMNNVLNRSPLVN